MWYEASNGQESPHLPIADGAPVGPPPSTPYGPGSCWTYVRPRVVESAGCVAASPSLTIPSAVT